MTSAARQAGPAEQALIVNTAQPGGSYVIVDGGMSDNIRTALYDARYTCVLASRESAAAPALSRLLIRRETIGDLLRLDAG